MNSYGVRPLRVFSRRPKIVGVGEVGEMAAELSMVVIVVSFDGRFFYRAVHSFDLSVSPRMIDLRTTMFDAILLAAHAEHVR